MLATPEFELELELPTESSELSESLALFVFEVELVPEATVPEAPVAIVLPLPCILTPPASFGPVPGVPVPVEFGLGVGLLLLLLLLL